MTYLLCWIPELALSRITPTAGLEQTLRQANEGCEYSLAKLVRVNWMIQHAKTHGIIKPIWCRDDHFQTIVGDTRVMAAGLAGLETIPALVYLKQPQGVICDSQAKILLLSGFDHRAQIHSMGSTDLLHEPPLWAEISHPTTSGHGHDQQRRLAAIQAHRARNTQPLDLEWLITPHDWGDIFS